MWLFQAESDPAAANIAIESSELIQVDEEPRSPEEDYVDAVVANIGDGSSGEVEIGAVSYDEHGAEFEKGRATTHTIASCETWLARIDPFWESDPERVDYYRVTGGFEPKRPAWPDAVEFNSHELDTNDGWTRVSGEVTNTSASEIYRHTAIAQFLDGEERLIYARWGDRNNFAPPTRPNRGI